jgi:hypothetical protein
MIANFGNSPAPNWQLLMLVMISPLPEFTPLLVRKMAERLF